MSDNTMYKRTPTVMLTAGGRNSCIHCGARPEVPNRRQRRSLRKLGLGNAPITVMHQPWCPLRVGGGHGDRRPLG